MRHRPIATLAAMLLTAPALAQHPGPEVRAPAGALRGTAAEGRAAVEAFLGVPYAAAPVGPLRWREPQPLPRWSGVRDAARFGARCMQQPLYSDMAFRSPAPSEDCLFLNVWRPAGARGGAGLPVLVFVHGGGFMAGDASERRYDGAAVAARGVVVVTVNYRLGAFGFLSHPALTAESPHRASGNYGLLDQVAALAWVKRNVAAFGGDPRRVTVGGESAGSMSVSGLMASPLGRDLMAGAIGESGALMAPVFRLAPLGQAEAAGQAFAASLGATGLSDLRAMPADALLAAQGQRRGGSFGPVLDGWFLREQPDATFAAGRQARVPLLVGSNSQENSAGSLLGGQPATVAGYREAVRQIFDVAADRVLALYPATSDADVAAAAQALASDRFLAHPTWKWFDLQRRAGLPVFFYEYRRVRPPSLAAAASGEPPLGAVHSAEIEYALGNLDANPMYGWTADDRRVSDVMSGYWVNFVRTGDPNGPGLPAWPAAGTGATPPRALIDVVTGAAPFAEQARYEAMDLVLRPRD